MNNQDIWGFQEDYLYGVINGATSGGGVLAVQANPDGSHGIQAVSRIAPPESAVFPNIGFMFTDFDEDVEGAAVHEIICRFAIVISVKLQHDPTTSELGQAALQYLRTYQNDNSGNGIAPLLRTDVTLGGMVRDSRFTHMERHVLVPSTGGDEAERIATAIYTFTTWSNEKLLF